MLMGVESECYVLWLHTVKLFHFCYMFETFHNKMLKKYCSLILIRFLHIYKQCRYIFRKGDNFLSNLSTANLKGITSYFPLLITSIKYMYINT